METFIKSDSTKVKITYAYGEIFSMLITNFKLVLTKKIVKLKKYFLRKSIIALNVLITKFTYQAVVFPVKLFLKCISKMFILYNIGPLVHKMITPEAVQASTSLKHVTPDHILSQLQSYELMVTLGSQPNAHIVRRSKCLNLSKPAEDYNWKTWKERMRTDKLGSKSGEEVIEGMQRGN